MQQKKIDPQILWRRYLVALALIAGFVTTSHVVSMMALAGDEESSAAINISGRQRMLSQRALALSEREFLDPTDEAATLALDNTVALFVRSHQALMQGGDLGLSRKRAEGRRWIYETEHNGVTLNEEVETFVEELAVMRGQIPGDVELARAHLHDLVLTDGFLAALDNAVHELELQANAEVAQLRRLSLFGLLAALLILFFEARFIFWPSQRAIADAFDDLMVSLDRAEAAEDRAGRVLSARTTFFANMSEDLQTPLKILRGYVDQVLRTDLPQAAARQLSLVQRASEQMEQIVNDVVDVRLLEEGLIEIEEQPVALSPFIDEVLATYQSRIERKGVVLKKDVSDRLPEWVSVDPKRFGQILDNLLSNAAKFTHEGEITVRATYFRDGKWALEVTDTGEGISFHNQDALFRRFVTKPGEPGRTTGGTGLGLPICHDLARLMGGQLTVESILGHGSTFRAVLPLHAAEAPASTSEETPKAVEAA
ncbi:MAG: ATP-binding protein [Pseudomonadota bacterium]